MGGGGGCREEIGGGHPPPTPSSFALAVYLPLDYTDCGAFPEHANKSRAGSGIWEMGRWGGGGVKGSLRVGRVQEGGGAVEGRGAGAEGAGAEF